MLKRAMKYTIEIRTEPETWNSTMFASIKKAAIEVKRKNQEKLAKEEADKLITKLKQQPVPKP